MLPTRDPDLTIPAPSPVAEGEYLPLSALQHLIFCERQCALIHIEQVWTENRFTVEGQGFHQRVDNEEGEARGDIRTAFGIRLRSDAMGLVGKADAVEFHRVNDDDGATAGTTLPGVEGLWRPYPVEYKRGRPKKTECDRVQLCAQALCLEEMLDVEIDDGALFYGKTRRRKAVRFDDELREMTFATARRLRELFNERITPPPVNDDRCEFCSLKEICLPEVTGKRSSIDNYLKRMTAQ